MKPINNSELRRAYIKFLSYFAFLLVFSVLAVFFFFMTANREVLMLNARVKQSNKLMAARTDINANFDLIMLRMQQLSQYTKMNSSELNNQNLILNDIQETNMKIQAKLQDNHIPLKSFDLYKKLSDNVATAANIKDSLFTTRFQIESLRSQVEACNRANQSAVNRIRGRFGR
jgi:hypothetical protein